MPIPQQRGAGAGPSPEVNLNAYAWHELSSSEASRGQNCRRNSMIDPYAARIARVRKAMQAILELPQPGRVYG